MHLDISGLFSISLSRGQILPRLILSGYWNLIWWHICVAVRQKDTWNLTPAQKHYYATQGCLWLWLMQSETKHFLQNVSHAVTLTTVAVLVPNNTMLLLMTTGRQPLHICIDLCVELSRCLLAPEGNYYLSVQFCWHNMLYMQKLSDPWTLQTT